MDSGSRNFDSKDKNIYKLGKLGLFLIKISVEPQWGLGNTRICCRLFHCQWSLLELIIFGVRIRI